MEDKNLDNLANAQTEIKELQNVMIDNVEKIIVRGDNLDQLKTSCEELEFKAELFNKRCNKVKHKTRLKRLKFKLILIAIILGFVVIFSVLVVLYFLFLK